MTRRRFVNGGLLMRYNDGCWSKIPRREASPGYATVSVRGSASDSPAIIVSCRAKLKSSKLRITKNRTSLVIDGTSKFYCQVAQHGTAPGLIRWGFSFGPLAILR